MYREILLGAWLQTYCKDQQKKMHGPYSRLNWSNKRKISELWFLNIFGNIFYSIQHYWTEEIGLRLTDTCHYYMFVHLYIFSQLRRSTQNNIDNRKLNALTRCIEWQGYWRILLFSVKIEEFFFSFFGKYFGNEFRCVSKNWFIR